MLFRNLSLARHDEGSATRGGAFFVLVVCTAIASLWWYDRVSDQRWAVLQQLLQFPPDIAQSSFASSTTDKSFAEVRPGVAEAAFSEAQLQAFLARIDAGPPTHRGPDILNHVPVVSYSPEALAWKKSFLPKRAGDKALRPEGLLPDASAGPQDIRVFCMVLQDPRAWDDPSPKLVFLARGCAEPGRTATISRVVIAVLDVPARKLRIRVE